MKVFDYVMYCVSCVLSITLLVMIVICILKFQKKTEIASLQTIRQNIVSCLELDVFKMITILQHISHFLYTFKIEKVATSFRHLRISCTSKRLLSQIKFKT